MGKTISLIDIYNPEKKGNVLESWFGLVMQLADGQHTIQQMIEFMASQYNGNPPGNLDETIDSVVKRLADSKLIVLANEKVDLPYYLSLPYEMLDVEKAKKELEEDRIDFN